MILTFVMPVFLFAFLFKKGKPLRRHWGILLFVGLMFALLLSFVSVWSAWDPYALSDSMHNGNFSGASALSFPLWLNVYTTPAGQRIGQGSYVTGNVSFDVFLANGKILETSGTLRYLAVMGTANVEYQLGPPFFSNGSAFFDFLLFLFTLFDMVGSALGLILCYVVSRRLASHVQVASRDRPPVIR